MDYRLVSKKCFCHACNKHFKKLLGPDPDSIRCELCDSLACEIVQEAPKVYPPDEVQQSMEQNGSNGRSEENQPGESTNSSSDGSYRIVFGQNQNQESNRVDINDRGQVPRQDPNTVPRANPSFARENPYDGVGGQSSGQNRQQQAQRQAPPRQQDPPPRQGPPRQQGPPPRQAPPRQNQPPPQQNQQFFQNGQNSNDFFSNPANVNSYVQEQMNNAFGSMNGAFSGMNQAFGRGGSFQQNASQPTFTQTTTTTTTDANGRQHQHRSQTQQPQPNRQQQQQQPSGSGSSSANNGNSQRNYQYSQQNPSFNFSVFDNFNEIFSQPFFTQNQSQNQRNFQPPPQPNPHRPPPHQQQRFNLYEPEESYSYEEDLPGVQGRPGAPINLPPGFGQRPPNFQNQQPRRNQAGEEENKEEFSPMEAFLANFGMNFRSSGINLNGLNLEEVLRRSEHEAHAARPAAREARERLPEIPILHEHCKEKPDGSVEVPTCTICVEDLPIGAKACFLPCGHIFHKSCIDPWLNQHNTCPICRFELPTQEEMNRGGNAGGQRAR